MTEHDSWDAQRQRAEYLIQVCSAVVQGANPAVAIGALVVAGVDGDIAQEVVDAALTDRDAMQEAKGKADDRDPSVDQAAEIIADAVRDGLLDSSTGLLGMAQVWLSRYEAQRAAATYPGRPVEPDLPEGMAWDGDAVVLPLGGRIEPDGHGGIVFRLADRTQGPCLGGHAVEAAAALWARVKKTE